MEDLIDEQEAFLDFGTKKKYQLFSAMFDCFIMRNYSFFCFKDCDTTFESQGFSNDERVKFYAKFTKQAIKDGRIIEVTPSLQDLRTEGILYKVSGIDKRQLTKEQI